MEQNKDRQVPVPKGHLDEDMIREQLQKLSSETAVFDNYDFLEHISHCSYCADHMAHVMEQEGLVHAPRDFRESVLAQTKSLKVQTELSIHKTSAKMQLFFYSLRVGGAILGALVILFLSSMALSFQGQHSNKELYPERPIQIQENFSLSQELHRSSNYLNQLLQDFSNQFILEDYRNDE